jgi:hypothetical protein
MIQPVFNYSNLVKMLPIFVRKTNELVNKWKTMLNGKESITLEIDEEMSNLTLDVLGLTAFSCNFNSVSAVDDKMSKTYKRLMTYFQVKFS